MKKNLFLNDKFILVLILINAVILFIEGYPISPIAGRFLSVVDHLITTLFIVELVVKTKENGLLKYLSSNWNRLDFVLILLSVPALVSFVVGIEIFDISFLLVFRILRVFKAFRFLKFIPNVEQLVSGVQRALKTSVFILIGFMTNIFIIGILSFYLFQNSGTVYFANPTTSLYSIFKIFTIEGWFEIPEQVALTCSTSESFFVYAYFIFVVVTGGIIGLSLVNSIFVDSMVSDNNDELEKKLENLDSKVTEILKKIKNHEA